MRFLIRILVIQILISFGFSWNAMAALDVIRSLTDLGAKCDGISDDSYYFSIAQSGNSGITSGMVKIPAYRTCVVNQAVEIISPLFIVGGSGSAIHLKGNGRFIIKSPDVKFSKVLIVSYNNLCAINLDNIVGPGRPSLERISIRDSEIWNSVCGISDRAPYTVASDGQILNGIANLNINGLRILRSRGPGVVLQSVFAFLRVKALQIEMVSFEGATAATAPHHARAAFQLENNAGATLSNIQVSGPSNYSPPPGIFFNGISVKHSDAVWLSDSSLSNLPGLGLVIADSALGGSHFSYLRNLRSINNLEGGFFFNYLGLLQAHKLFSTLGKRGLQVYNSQSIQVSDLWVDSTSDLGLAFHGNDQVQISQVYSVGNQGQPVFAPVAASLVKVNGYDFGTGNVRPNSSVLVGLDLTQNTAPLMAPQDTPLSLRDKTLNLADLLASPDLVSIYDYIGDANFFQSALDSGKTIYVPPGMGCHSISTTLHIRKPVRIFSLTKTCLEFIGSAGFSIESSDVTIGGFEMKSGSGAAIQISAAAAQIRSNISLVDLTIIGFRRGISNEGTVGAGINNLLLENIVSRWPSGTPVALFKAANSTFRWITIDQTSSGAPVQDFSGFWISEAKNILIDESTTLGNGLWSYSDTASTMALVNSSQVYLTRYMADTSNSHGLWIEQGSNIHIKDFVASQNALSGMTVSGATNVYSVNTVLSGREGTRLPRYSQGNFLFRVFNANNFSLLNSNFRKKDGEIFLNSGSNLILQNSYYGKF